MLRQVIPHRPSTGLDASQALDVEGELQRAQRAAGLCAKSASGKGFLERGGILRGSVDAATAWLVIAWSGCCSFHAKRADERPPN